MHKLPFALLAVAALAGCAQKPSTYTYEPKHHSGTVHASQWTVGTPKWWVYGEPVTHCDPNWLNGTVYTPKGIPTSLDGGLKVQIDAYSPDQGRQVINVDVPFSVGDKVLTKDLQRGKSYMLGADSHGMLAQGEFFNYPEGYLLRVSKPEIEGDNIKACIALERKYVLQSDLNGQANPPVYLDRIVMGYVEKDGAPVKVDFGSEIKHTVEIRVTP